MASSQDALKWFGERATTVLKDRSGHSKLIIYVDKRVPEKSTKKTREEEEEDETHFGSEIHYEQ